LRSSLTAADPGINSFVSQNWTVALGFKETQAWRPWTVDGKQQMGGYVTRYENNFDFLTIRGAGHMVPEFKPTASLAFLTAFLKNEDYMPYAKPPPKFPIGKKH
jgi:carboxypeptidase C (cathepsin A)